MKINKFINLIIASVLLLGNSFNALADNKPFYTSKSNKIGITGDIDLLNQLGFKHNLFNNPIKIRTKLTKPDKDGWDETLILRQLNEEEVGKKVLDYLFLNSSKCFDESLTILSERIGKNITKRDLESKKAELTITEGVSNKEIMEILSNNYIFFSEEVIDTIITKNNGIKQYSYKKHLYWIAFHIDITENDLDNIYKAWDMSISTIDNSIYENITIDVKFVAQGHENDYMIRNVDSNKFILIDDEIYDLARDISKKVPAFANRGLLESRKPLISSLGTKDGAEDNMRVDIYRQQLDKRGNYYSKKVSSARICDINYDNSRLYFISGSKGSPEMGDQVVISKDSKSGFSLYGHLSKGTIGGMLNYDALFGTTKSGLESLLKIRLGVSFTENRDSYIIDGINYKPVTIINGGIGYGLKYTLLGRLSITPYTLLQYEHIEIPEAEPDDWPEEQEFEGRKEKVGYFQIPIGVEFNLNICYPVQLMFGAEYVIGTKWSPNGAKDDPSYYSEDEEVNGYEFVNDNIFKNIGVKRDGLSLYAGIRIAF